MNDTKTRSGFGWGFLLVGILFIIASLIAFYDPAANLVGFTYAFAAMAIVYGVWMLATNRGRALRIVGGILDILIGVFMIVNIYWSVLAIPYIFAAWFILDSLFRLLTVGATRLLGTGYFVFSIIVNILGIVVGVLLLFEPVTAALTLSFMAGFYLMLAGVECIVLAFSTHR